MAFHGKVALLAGGASGMGRVSALRLAAQKAKVAVADINKKALGEIAKQSDHITTYPMDVTNQEQVEEIVAQVESDLGPIDRLVHSAAIMPGISLKDMPAEKINQVMIINYCGMVNVTKAVLKDRKLLSDEKRIASGKIGCQENKIQDVV
jgi:NAD(P)-dependent dehydrogenase (short-subunit alcohol dehydrogenase family)